MPWSYYQISVPFPFIAWDSCSKDLMLNQSISPCWYFSYFLLPFYILYRYWREKLVIKRLSSLNNPLTPMSDQDIISLNINTISSGQVMRIRKNISRGIVSWSNTKFSKLTLLELYGRQWGEFMMRSWGMEGRVQETKASRLCDCGHNFFYLFIFWDSMG